MHAVGYNCLPRNGIDWAALETHYERHQPALSVVFLEPSGIERLRAKSPNTLYVYRHHVPGFDNDDDAQDRMENAVAFVDMLHALAPAGGAIYLGNEPTGNWGKLASWTLAALDRCDQLGRTGVVLNLAYGNPEPDVWKRELKPVLDRIANTRHILGLHEYFAPGNLGKGFWTQRWVGHIPQSAKVAITELGALEHVSGAVLNARKGWRRLPDYPASAYAADIRAVVDDYRRQPNFVGAAIFSVGTWEGCEVGKEMFDEMEQYDGEIVVTQTNWQPRRIVPTGNFNVNIRASAPGDAQIIGRIPAGGVDGHVDEATLTADWHRVRVESQVGYVSAAFIRIESVPPLPPVEPPVIDPPIITPLPLPDLNAPQEVRDLIANALEATAKIYREGIKQTS